MFGFNFRFGRSRQEKRGPAAGKSAPGKAFSATQRELVRLSLHGVLKRHGIPSPWIVAEISELRSPDGAPVTHWQLVVKEWHDKLMQYAPALQQELIADIKRFDPDADAAHYVYSWKFAAELAGAPTQLPEPGFWTTTAVPASVAATAGQPAAAASVAKPKFDLPPSAADLDDSDNGFVPTIIVQRER